MKARVPYDYDSRAQGKRKQAVASAMLLFAKAVQESEGFGVKRLTQLLACTDKAVEDVAGWRYGKSGNTTWGEEIDHWADIMELPVPKGNAYRLRLSGEITAGGQEQRRLVLLLLYALSMLGYGKLRLNRVCRHYGEVAGFDRGGRAAYSRRELREWADSIGLKYV